MKIALISGITGQDGSYLAEFLLKKGYEVHGIIRRASSFNTQRLENIYKDPHIPDNRLHLHYGDITDTLSIDQIMMEVCPDEIYHLGAQSHVRVSFDVPGYTCQTDAFGTLNMLEAMRKHASKAKFYNAATSELFGKVVEIPQNETTPFNPRSPYGVAKLYAYHIVKNYRESYNLFAVNGILFNHESERRGSTFVTKKITEGLIKYLKDGTPFYLGNIEAQRDWGYAPDFVEGMWMMLQQENPDDFILATGETHTIKEFVDQCIKFLFIKGNEYPISHPYGIEGLKDAYGIEIKSGIFKKYHSDVEQGVLNVITHENPLMHADVVIPLTVLVEDYGKFEWRKDFKGRKILWDKHKDRLVIGIDEKYYRPSEVELLQGDSTKAEKKLGWIPKVKFKELVKRMMENEKNN